MFICHEKCHLLCRIVFFPLQISGKSCVASFPILARYKYRECGGDFVIEHMVLVCRSRRRLRSAFRNAWASTLASSRVRPAIDAIWRSEKPSTERTVSFHDVVDWSIDWLDYSVHRKVSDRLIDCPDRMDSCFACKADVDWLLDWLCWASTRWRF